jgi:hypothetical protein
MLLQTAVDAGAVHEKLIPFLSLKINEAIFVNKTQERERERRGQRDGEMLSCELVEEDLLIELKRNN